MNNRRFKTNKERLDKGSLQEDIKKKDSNKSVFRKKIYSIQNPLLTDLRQNKHVQSIYNAITIFIMYLFIGDIIYYWEDIVKFCQDYESVRRVTSTISSFIVVLVIMFLFAYIHYEGFVLWVFCRKRISRKVFDRIFFLLYLALVVLTSTVTSYAVLKIKILPILAAVLMLKQVAFFMKVYSFVRENVPREKLHEDGNQQHNLYPSRKYFLYYLCAPTLTYRDAYPQNEKIHWDKVAHNLFGFVSVIFIVYYLVNKYFMGLFKSIPSDSFHRQKLASIVIAAITISFPLSLLVFYAVFHCYVNVIAELTRFGNQKYYKDWWNSTSCPQFFRLWNIEAHDWLHCYVYQDLIKVGFSKYAAATLTMVVSALTHEYMLSVSTGFIYPYLSILYCTSGALAFILTEGRTGQLWSMFMWGSIILGVASLVLFYSAEWVARNNCPTNGTLFEFLIPKSWNSSCGIFNLL